MAATTNQVRVRGFLDVAEQTEVTDSIRHLQNSILSELPGVAFAFITLAYIATQLITL